MATFCGVPTSLEGRDGASFFQWPMGQRLTWTVIKPIQGFSVADLQDIAKAAWKLWDEVCGISIEYTATPGNANILIGARQIDGPLNVLAEAELPPPGIRPDAQLRLWLDEGERWVNAFNAPPQAIDVLRVLIHEQGHTLGLGHQPDQTIASIMAPSISQIRTLQQWEKNQSQLRYGIEKPPQPPPGGGDDDFADLLEQIAKCLRTLNPGTRSLVRELLRDV